MIKAPPKNEEGKTEPHDHTDILDDHEVIRRVSKEHIVIDKDGNHVISSALYQTSTEKDGGMSVDIKQLIENDKKCPQEWVTTPKWMGSVLLSVSDLRKEEFIVGYDPLEEPEPNPYHGEVWGSFTKSKKRKLKKLAIWFVEIPDVKLSS